MTTNSLSNSFLNSFLKNSTFPSGLLGLDKTLEEIRRDGYEHLNDVHQEYTVKGYLPQTLNLNRGPARALIELASFGRHRVNEDITDLLPQCFPLYATGAWLDLHAGKRLDPAKRSPASHGTVIFSRQKAGGNVRIPADRLVRTKPDGLGKTYRFVTTAEVVLPEDELSVTAPVIAETYGQASNVTVSAICEIATAVSGIEAVTNAADWLITEGADQENDESLRHRYFLRWKSISGLNKYFFRSHWP